MIFVQWHRWWEPAHWGAKTYWVVLNGGRSVFRQNALPQTSLESTGEIFIYIALRGFRNMDLNRPSRRQPNIEPNGGKLFQVFQNPTAARTAGRHRCEPWHRECVASFTLLLHPFAWHLKGLWMCPSAVTVTSKFVTCRGDVRWMLVKCHEPYELGLNPGHRASGPQRFEQDQKTRKGAVALKAQAVVFCYWFKAINARPWLPQKKLEPVRWGQRDLRRHSLCQELFRRQHRSSFGAISTYL